MSSSIYRKAGINIDVHPQRMEGQKSVVLQMTDRYITCVQVAVIVPDARLLVGPPSCRLRLPRGESPCQFPVFQTAIWILGLWLSVSRISNNSCLGFGCQFPAFQAASLVRTVSSW